MACTCIQCVNFESGRYTFYHLHVYAKTSFKIMNDLHPVGAWKNPRKLYGYCITLIFARQHFRYFIVLGNSWALNFRNLHSGGPFDKQGTYRYRKLLKMQKNCEHQIFAKFADCTKIKCSRKLLKCCTVKKWTDFGKLLPESELSALSDLASHNEINRLWFLFLNVLHT